MYRGKDIGDPESLTRKIVDVIEQRRTEQLRSYLPLISVIRSPRFKRPLLTLLVKGNIRQKELAAIALGSLGDPEAIGPLHGALGRPKKLKGREEEAFQAAVILALGEIGNGDAVAALGEIYSREGEASLVRFRQQMALYSLGLLAQQGSHRAEIELARLLGDRDESTQILALDELVTAYWQRPHEVPDSVVHKMSQLAESGKGQLRRVAVESLRSLADSGCPTAEEYFALHRGVKRYA